MQKFCCGKLSWLQTLLIIHGKTFVVGQHGHPLLINPLMDEKIWVLVQCEDSMFIQKSVHLSLARYLHASLLHAKRKRTWGIDIQYKVGETVGHLNCVLDESLITIDKKNSQEKFHGMYPINPRKPWTFSTATFALYGTSIELPTHFKLL